MQASTLPAIGAWSAGESAPSFAASQLLEACQRVREPAYVLQDPQTGRVGVGLGGRMSAQGWPLLASLPALYPEWLGDRSFAQVHGVRFPYVAGAMANGIATTRLVIEMARAGMLGFFGAAGLGFERVEEALVELSNTLGTGEPGQPAWGSNLIHSPQEPELEERVADLYLRYGVRRVSASAYMALTPAIVRYAASGLHVDAQGHIQRRNHVFAKISRPEVAKRFLMPAPQEMLTALVAKGLLTADEARLARLVPVAEDFTVESDSGGHTDNQTLTALFPIIIALRDRVAAEQKYTRPIRVGAAGGLGSPSAVAAAFALGAAYVLTGSVNQGAVESGLSEAGRLMLAQASLADVVMAPAADMFELGVKVQVLQRGTMFGSRGHKLYELYRKYNALEDIPPGELKQLEQRVLQLPVSDVWAQTQSFWQHRDPRELEKAARDPHHRMALCFRWYLGQSSRWAIRGDANRRLDYQIWCGPAMGAFNDWAAGSFLEPPEARTVVQIALNLMEGAAVISRAQQLRSFGVSVPSAAFRFRPRPLA